MTSRLEQYNSALLDIGERKLTSLTDSTESRRILDTIWESGHVRTVLSKGLWNFAMRTAKIDYDPAISEPEFGLKYAFQKPEDWVRTASVSLVGTFDPPLLEYVDEAGYWWSDSEPLYVRFVSSHDNYGGDLSLWTELFSEFSAKRLAWKFSRRPGFGEERIDGFRRDMEIALREAAAVDAMDEPVKFAPAGSWVRARMRGGSVGGMRKYSGGWRY